MIPRKGMKFTIRRGKAKRKSVVIITGLYRRAPLGVSRTAVGRELRHRYQVYYRTDGTWAAHGERTKWLRGFLQLVEASKL